MSSRHESDPDIVDPLADDPLAFLYEPGDDEGEEDSTADHPGYGSLMGVGVHRTARPGKTPVIALDEVEAQRAVEVMEINAGQLMTNPDRSSRQIGFLGLDPVEALEIEGEEDDLADTLSWNGGGADEEADDPDWKPENPQGGTDFEDEDEDPDWQPENPLAGTEFAEQGEWDEPDEAPQPFAGAPQFAVEDDWEDPLPPAEVPAAELPPTELPAPEQAAVADEQAWSPNEAEPVAPEPRFEEVEWDGPFAAAEPEEQSADAPMALDAPGEDADPTGIEEQVSAQGDVAQEPADPAPVEWQSFALDVGEDPADPPASEEQATGESEVPPEPAEREPIPWQSLLAAKRPGRHPVDLTPIDWGEFAAEEEAEEESGEPVPIEWQSHASDVAEDPAEPDSIEWTELNAEDLPEDTPPPDHVLPEPAEPEWQRLTADEASEPDELPEPEWRSFALENAGESAIEQPDIPFEPAEPQQIEIVCFPAPPIVETPHHSLRAKVMKAHAARPPSRSLTGAAFKWLRARFEQVVLPLLKRLLAWARTEWARIVSRRSGD